MPDARKRHQDASLLMLCILVVVVVLVGALRDTFLLPTSWPFSSVPVFRNTIRHKPDCEQRRLAPCTRNKAIFFSSGRAGTAGGLHFGLGMLLKGQSLLAEREKGNQTGKGGLFLKGFPGVWLYSDDNGWGQRRQEEGLIKLILGRKNIEVREREQAFLQVSLSLWGAFPG